MPVISFVQPKGGAGKSTAALVLATELAKGSKVTLIDADPNRPMVKWQKRGGEAANLTIVENDDEVALLDDIRAAAQTTPFVLVDLEGTRNLANAYAISMSDFVVIPCQGSTLDSDEASRAVRLIRNEETRLGRNIPHAIMLTKISPAIRTRTLKHIEDDFIAGEVDVMTACLFERDAFRALFSFAATLDQLDPSEVSGLDKARANARAFALEVVTRLQEGEKAKKKGAAA